MKHEGVLAGERPTEEAGVLGVVLSEHKSSTGLRLLRRIADSICVIDGMACWDHGAMYDLRDEIERLLDVESTKQAEKAQPVAYIHKETLEWLTDEDRGVFAFTQAWLHKSPGGDFDVPIYAHPPTPSALLEAAESVIDWIAGDYKEGSPEANALGNLIAAIQAHKKAQS